MADVWRVLTEIAIPGETVDDNETVVGFTNWITQANDAQHALDKVKFVISEYGWTLFDHEAPEVIDLTFCYHEEVDDMVERALSNSSYVLYGTVHTYKPS